MNKTAALTICAKNYLAQALALRSSFKTHNPEYDFFIFLADARTPDCPADIIQIDESIVNYWQSLAFKYNVIEYSTSVKPFCIYYLFELGYENVMYIDPDIYVYNSLALVVDKLSTYSAVLTPHRTIMTPHKEGIVTNTQIAQNGIYNLGFLAIKNNNIGNRIIEWWKDILTNYCYLEYSEGLATDQKWMDCLPGYFPNDVFISHHPGLNAALWNFVERNLFLDNGNAYISDIESNIKKSLIFFHFSGCNPNKINRLFSNNIFANDPNFNVFSVLVRKYHEELFKYDFSKYSQMDYAYNSFENGDPILPINRRIYRANESIWKSIINPFSCSNDIYVSFNHANLIAHIKHQKRYSQCNTINTIDVKKRNNRILAVIHKCMKLLLRVIGVVSYQKLLRGVFLNLAKFENNSFLIKK